MRNIEKWSLGYEVLRAIGQATQWFEHQEIVITGKENIPKGKPVILAPNHQNALSDSLSILLNTNLQPVFLGRADMFKKKPVARILRFFKLMPVYRIRDGKDTLDRNKEVFDDCVRILRNNKMICIYPEAAHNGQKSMLPHKKAIPRIAFQAAEQTNFQIDLKVLPIGIYYSHYNNYKRKLCVEFGEPIHVKDYYNLYKEQGEAKAQNDLRLELSNRIKALVVNVDDRKSYPCYDYGFEMYRKQALNELNLTNSVKNYVEAEQWLTNKFKEGLIDNSEKEHLVKAASLYNKLLQKLGLDINLYEKGGIKFGQAIWNYFAALVLFPFGFYSIVVNGWLFYLARYSYRNKVKDTHFWSTMAFGISFIFFPLWYLIQFFVLNAIFDEWYWVIGILALSVGSNLLAWECWSLIRDTTKRLKLAALIRNNESQILQLKALREQLDPFFAKVFR